MMKLIVLVANILYNAVEEFCSIKLFVFLPLFRGFDEI